MLICVTAASAFVCKDFCKIDKKTNATYIFHSFVTTSKHFSKLLIQVEVWIESRKEGSQEFGIAKHSGP